MHNEYDSSLQVLFLLISISLIPYSCKGDSLVFDKNVVQINDSTSSYFLQSMYAWYGPIVENSMEIIQGKIVGMYMRLFIYAGFIDSSCRSYFRVRNLL